MSVAGLYSSSGCVDGCCRRVGTFGDDYPYRSRRGILSFCLSLHLWRGVWQDGDDGTVVRLVECPCPCIGAVSSLWSDV